MGCRWLPRSALPPSRSGRKERLPPPRPATPKSLPGWRSTSSTARNASPSWGWLAKGCTRTSSPFATPSPHCWSHHDRRRPPPENRLRRARLQPAYGPQSLCRRAARNPASAERRAFLAPCDAAPPVGQEPHLLCRVDVLGAIVPARNGDRLRDGVRRFLPDRVGNLLAQ